jgi:hypothetical protein
MVEGSDNQQNFEQTIPWKWIIRGEDGGNFLVVRRRLLAPSPDDASHCLENHESPAVSSFETRQGPLLRMRCSLIDHV